MTLTAVIQFYEKNKTWEIFLTAFKTILEHLALLAEIDETCSHIHFSLLI